MLSLDRLLSCMINLCLLFHETTKLCSKVAGTSDIPLRMKFKFLHNLVSNCHFGCSLINNGVGHFYVLDYHLNTFAGEISNKIFGFYIFTF